MRIILYKNGWIKSKILNNIFCLGILIYLFLSPTTAAALGVTKVATTSTFLLTILIFLLLFLKLGNFFEDSRGEFFIIVVGFVSICIKFILEEKYAFKDPFFLIIFPMLLSIFMRYQSETTLRKIRFILLLFFILECSFAGYERLFSINIFPMKIEDTANLFNLEREAWMFRSTAFLGHPLINALAISTILGFILTTEHLKFFPKIVFMILGSFAGFCFNARAFTILWAILIPIFVFHYILTNKNNLGVNIVILYSLTTIIFLFSFLIVSTHLGGRLTHTGLIDGSAMARLRVYKVFYYLPRFDFWFGNPKNYISMMRMLNAAGVENSFVVLIIKYGVITTFFLVCGYFLWFKSILIKMDLFFKFIIMSSFIVLGMSNNGLVSSYPWCLFVVCLHSFKCENLNSCQSESKD